MSLITYKNADRPFRCTVAQAGVLDTLSTLRKGGIGIVNGYKPSTNVIPGKQPVYNLRVITAFNLSRLYQRKVKALEALTFGDVAADIAHSPKLKALPTGEALDLFNKAVAASIASMTQTLDGDRSGAHREGHDRCYIKVADGVKVNLVTVKDADGLMQPVLTDGLPTVASIMLPVLELNKTVVVEGEYKTVNSGPKVLMDGIIAKHLNQRSVGYKTLSLKDDNFESVNVAKQTISPEDLKVSENKSKLLSLLEACGFDGDALKVIALLEAEGAKL